MNIIKNENYILEITDIGVHGEGIGKVDGFAVFVEGACIGDKIKIKMLKVKKNYGYGKIESIIKPSEFRTEPICPSFGKCGGCSLQHMDYKKQLEFKTKKVKDTIERIGGIENPNVLDIKGMDNPLFYRNKAQYPVGQNEDNVVIGFYAKRSHRIIETPKCYIQNKDTNEIVKCFKEFMLENNIPPYDEQKHKGIVRHLIIRTSKKTGNIMVVVVVNSNGIAYENKLIEKLLNQNENIKSIVININKKRTNTVLGNKNKSVFGNDFITDYIGKLKFQVSPLSFFQVNPIQTEVLYNTAINFAELTGEETVIDAYCGIGTISLFLAKKAKFVYGIEVVADAVKDAVKNADINGIFNVEFIEGKSESIIPKLHNEGIKADCIVLDPPRKGCDELIIDTIINMTPKKIVYVSCDCATLARDIKRLCKGGYTFVKAQPVDMFCMTEHVETVVLMSKTDK